MLMNPTLGERGCLLGSQQYVYRWDRHGRKGQLCLVLARGTMNSCPCKFEDGYNDGHQPQCAQARHRRSFPAAALPKIEAAE